MVILSTNSPSPVLSSLSSDVGSGGIIDGNLLQNANTVPDGTGDESPSLEDGEHHAELDEAFVREALCLWSHCRAGRWGLGTSNASEVGKEIGEEEGPMRSARCDVPFTIQWFRSTCNSSSPFLRQLLLSNPCTRRLFQNPSHSKIVIGAIPGFDADNESMPQLTKHGFYEEP